MKEELPKETKVDNVPTLVPEPKPSEEATLPDPVVLEDLEGLLKEKSKKNGISKRAVFGLISFFIILLVALGFAFYFSNRGENAKVQLTPEVENNKQTFSVSVGYLEGNAWKDVDGRKVEVLEDDVLQEGDKIQTDVESRIVLFIDDGSVIRIGENSEAVLVSLLLESIVIDQKAGVIFARVEKSDNHEFIVAAKDILVHSLGTAFSVDVNEEVSVSVFESKVKVIEEGEKDVEVTQNNSWEKEIGVKALSDEKLADNKFLTWSLEEEKIADVTATPTQKPDPTSSPEDATSNTTSSGPISLSAKATDGGIYLNWEVRGVDVSKGFKIVRNTSGNPTFPGDSMTYVDSNTRSHTLGLFDGKTWKIRICAYAGNGCGDYSNEVSVSAPSEVNSTVKSISVSASYVGDGKVEVNWSVDGYSPKGYKVVYSKNSGPTYPSKDGDDYIYVSNPDTKSAKIKNVPAGWKTYIRVCEYTSKCGVYSNEVSIEY